MVQIVVSKATPISGIHPGASDAESFAQLARNGVPGAGFSESIGGVSVRLDRLAAAAGARLAGEAAALQKAAANATEAISLLQITDAALTDIDGRLASLETLAKKASSGQAALSTADRTTLDLEFKALLSEIDTITAQTSYGAILPLAGGSGPGGALEFDVTVGTGTAASADKITVSLAPASVSDLSASLPTADLLSQSNAATVLTAVQGARDELDQRRGAVAGTLQGLSSAAIEANSRAAVLRRAGEDLGSAEISVDFARIVADQVVDEGGINLTAGTERLLQGLLLSLQTGRPDNRDTQADQSVSDTPAAPAISSAPAAPAVKDNAEAS